MPNIVIYTTPICSYCTRAKRLLASKKVDFTEIDVSQDAELRQSMTERAGGRYTVPQIFVDETYIGDSDGIYALERVGKLDAILAGETS